MLIVHQASINRSPALVSRWWGVGLISVIRTRRGSAEFIASLSFFSFSSCYSLFFFEFQLAWCEVYYRLRKLGR